MTKPLAHQIPIIAELLTKKKALIYLPSGAGKTHTIAFDVLQKKPKSFIYIVHRNEILYQTVKIFKEICAEFMNDSNMGILNQDSKEYHKPYLFVMINTLSRTKNLEKIDYKTQYIVIDEFHHAAAKSYKKVLDYFVPKYLYGLTATPDRTDLQDIKHIVENNIVGDMDLFTGVAENVLVPFNYKGKWDDIDYSDIKNNGHQYKENDLDKKLLIDKRDQATIREYRKEIEPENRLTIGFCNSVKHVRRITDKFNIAGIKAAGITYEDSIEERSQIMNNFRKGIYKILFTRDVLNEGVDFPECEAIMFLRPTFSKIVFMQQLGRGLRKRIGKKNVLVIDFIGNYHNAYKKTEYLKEIMEPNRLVVEPGARFKPEYHYDVPQSIVEFETKIIDLFKLQYKGYSKEEVEEIFKKYIDEIHEKRDLDPITESRIKNDFGKNFFYYIQYHHHGINNLIYKLGYIKSPRKKGTVVTSKQLDLNFDNVVKRLGRTPAIAEIDNKNLSKFGERRYKSNFGNWANYLVYRNLKPRIGSWTKELIKKRYFELKNELTGGKSIPTYSQVYNRDLLLQCAIQNIYKNYTNFIKETEHVDLRLKNCIYCQKEFRGSSKSRFCSSSCRSRYNYRKYSKQLKKIGK